MKDVLGIGEILNGLSMPMGIVRVAFEEPVALKFGDRRSGHLDIDLVLQKTRWSRKSNAKSEPRM